MKIVPLVLAILFIAAVQALQAEDSITVESLGTKLDSVIAKFFPEKSVEHGRHDGKLSIAFSTMPFQVHNIDKTGIIAERPHEEIGPKADGFLIHLTHQDGPFRGAAEYPQTFVRPYWKTFGTQIPVEGNRNHIHVSFSYGHRVPDDFVVAIIQALKPNK